MNCKEIYVFPEAKKEIFDKLLNMLESPDKNRNDIFQEVKKIYDIIGIKNYKQIFVNKNKPFSQKKGPFSIVSFGNYAGGDLIVENLIFSTKFRAVHFPGNLLRYCDSKRISGNKYSLIFV